MKYKILELLKNSKDFVSGQQIAEKFNVSRTSVWKNITKLKSEGYHIVSVSNKGYMLQNDTDILNEGEIEYRPIVFIEEVPSTNDLAKEYANKGCEDGLLVVCNNQTRGKGRLGRSWACEKNSTLCMSIVLKPAIMPIQAPQLTLIAGIACVRAIKKIVGIDSGIKWPNDIIINGKKVIGILTEMSAEIESVKYVVVGMGINVNNEDFPDDIKYKATSLYLETGKKYKRSDFATTINQELFELYKIYCKNGFSYFVEEYNKMCINVGKEVKTVGNNSIDGIAIGVNETGEILIQNDTGIHQVLSGEVSLRLKDDSYI